LEHIAVGAKTYEYLATGLPILAEHRLATTPSLSGNMLQPDTL